jgi:chromosome segregation ATPase
MVSELQIIALVEQLERKIGLLKGVCDDAKKRINQLEEQNSELNDKLKEQQTLSKELQKKLDNSEKKISKSKDFGIIVNNNLSGTDTNAEFKKQLDEYIRELERCIAHLSSLS